MELIPEFQNRLKDLPLLLEQLLRASPHALTNKSTLPNKPGVYVIAEGENHLYTGRSKNLRQRMKNHASGRAEQSAFAFRLARQLSGKTRATYKKEGSRKELMKDQNFIDVMAKCTTRVKNMSVLHVEIEDDVTQHMFEVYCALALKTQYNEFKTS
jgi:predicted GIY-YIG superfamily endonuclease